jgi:hypothetical protein
MRFRRSREKLPQQADLTLPPRQIDVRIPGIGVVGRRLQCIRFARIAHDSLVTSCNVRDVRSALLSSSTTEHRGGRKLLHLVDVHVRRIFLFPRGRSPPERCVVGGNDSDTDCPPAIDPPPILLPFPPAAAAAAAAAAAPTTCSAAVAASSSASSTLRTTLTLRYSQH